MAQFSLLHKRPGPPGSPRNFPGLLLEHKEPGAWLSPLTQSSAKMAACAQPHTCFPYVLPSALYWANFTFTSEQLSLSVISDLGTAGKDYLLLKETKKYFDLIYSDNTTIT
jgi:hypothetical protein